MKKTLAIAAVIGLTACSGQPASQPSMSAGPVTTAASPSPTPSPTPSVLRGKVGDSYIGIHLDHTLEEYNPKVTTTASGQTWQAALVKTCAKGDRVVVSSFWWQAIGENSGRYGNAGSYYDDAPKPLYPIAEESVPQGECVRGWILFDADADVKITEVRYASESDIVARWTL